jgi:hypothetical protein
MKRRIQEKSYDQTKNLSREEPIAYFRRHAMPRRVRSQTCGRSRRRRPVPKRGQRNPERLTRARRNPYGRLVPRMPSGGTRPGEVPDTSEKVPDTNGMKIGPKSL